jgi:hypothetical protein
MAMPVEIYNKNEQAKQGKLQNVQLEEKWGTRNNGVKSCVQGDKQIKEKLDVKWNKRSGDISGRPHPADSTL